MAAVQHGNVSVYAHGHSQIAPEGVASSLIGSGAAYEIPGGESGLRAFGSGPNAPMRRFVVQTMLREWALRNDLDAPSSVGAGTDDAYRQFHVPEPRRLADARLADALAELAEVDDEIAEENLPQVGETTKVEAERLVRALTGRAPARVLLAVYPTQDAGIALHFKAPGRPDAVLVLLRDGRADCHAYIGGRSRRAHYGTSSDLPDVWVLDQLRHLAPTPVGVSTPGAGFSPSWTAFLSKNLLLTW